EVADDTTATGQAATIVIVVAIVSAIITGLLESTRSGGSVIGVAIVAVINILIGWLVGSVLLAWVSKQFFNGKTDTGEMLRVTGYASIFNILQVIPVIGGIIGSI